IGRSAQGRARLAALGADPIALDIFDAEAARRAMAGHDVVINLATHMPSSVFRTMLPWEWRENDRIRREGASTLAEAALAAGVSRFIQESFAPVYADGGAKWIDESWPQRPAPYNRTVLDAERSANRFTGLGGAGIVLRFAGFYGADPFLRDMLAVVRRGWAPVPGRGDAYWSSVSHADAASAVVASLALPAGTYNVCDDEPLTRRSFADALADAAELRSPRLMPSWMTAVGGKLMELLSRSQRMSNAKLRGASNWQAKWPSAREGLRVAVVELSEVASGRLRPTTPS
ncbi:MAG: NAD(P)-dependent oxidoreductase, partial [Gemmatimonadaceae bacterium]